MHSIRNDIYRSLFPNGKYLTYGWGRRNLLLSAPHGGGMKPITIPNRTYGNRGKDSYTRRIIEALVKRFPDQPYYVYSDIHRCKIDLNRGIEESAQGNPEMERVWEDWNKLLYGFTDEIRTIYGRGLYIDIHSHNKSDYFELGYDITAKTYNAIKSREKYKETPTISHLNLENIYDGELMFGKYSFATSLEKNGFKVLVPTNDKHYLNGGRNVETFSGEGIGGIQIECPISVMKRDLNSVIDTLEMSIEIFMEKFL